MSQYASINTDFYIATKRYPRDARELYLWSIINDHMHRVTGFGRYNDDMAKDETGMSIVRVKKARAWLERAKKWLIVDGWLLVLKRSSYELTKNDGDPNVKLTLAAINYIRGNHLPRELVDEYAARYGHILDTRKIPYRWGIQNRRVSASVSVSVSEAVTVPASEPPTPHKTRRRKTTAAPAEEPGPYETAFIDALESFAKSRNGSADPAHYEVSKRDRSALLRWRKRYPTVSADTFARTAAAAWPLGQYCPASAFTIRGLCRDWIRINLKTADKRAADPKLEARARIVLTNDRKALQERLDRARKYPDSSGSAFDLREMPHRLARLEKPDAWKLFLNALK